MRRLRLVLPTFLPSWVVAILVALAVTAIVLGLRGMRLLEPTELAVYDRFLRIRAPGLEAAPDPRIVVVTISERDIQEQGTWPLPDGVLAQTLDAWSPSARGRSGWTSIGTCRWHRARSSSTFFSAGRSGSWR